MKAAHKDERGKKRMWQKRSVSEKFLSDVYVHFSATPWIF